MKTRLWTLAALLLLAPSGHPRAQSAQTPFFMTLPPDVLPHAVGANGWVSTGLHYRRGAMYWMPSTGMTDIGGIEAVTVSRDGNTIIGNAFDSRGRQNAAIWTGATTWRTLGSFTPDAQQCDLSYSSAYGTNGDGTVIVGLAWDGCKFARAFRWDEKSGMVNLGSLRGQSTRANGISADGQVVVGWEESLIGPREGAKWVNRAEQLIKSPTGGAVGEAFGVNRDGTIITGTNCDYNATTGSPTGWVWTSSKGLQCLPVDRPNWLPPQFYNVLVQATSDDGRVMGGSYSFGLDAEALIWLDGKVYFLKDYLRDNGVINAFRDWVNSGFITGVTPDGRTLVGYGAGPTTFQGYMVVLPDRGKP